MTRKPDFDLDRPATPSSAERFGGEMSPINLGNLDDTQLAQFLRVLGKRGPDGIPEGMPEIVKNARANGGIYVPKPDDEG